MTLNEFMEYMDARVEDEVRQLDDKYFMTAWLASHIMNSTGNYKKQLTPHILLGRSDRSTEAPRFESAEAKQQALEELKAKMERAKQANMG